MVGQLDPDMKAARDKEISLLGRSMLAPLLLRLVMLPVLVVVPSLFVAGLIWAGLWILSVTFLFVVLASVMNMRRSLRVRDVTIGAYWRAKRAGLPAPAEVEAPFLVNPDVAAWGGLPPSARWLSQLWGAAGLVSCGLAVILGLGVAAGPELVVTFEVGLAVVAVVAVVAWWWRCDRAVWMYSSRWWRVWLGWPQRWRIAAAIAGFVVVAGFVVWAGSLLSVSGLPWAVDGVPCVDPTRPVWGMCVSAQGLAAAVRGDAVGNLGILGFVFLIAWLNSLGGTRQTSPTVDATD